MLNLTYNWITCSVRIFVFCLLRYLTSVSFLLIMSAKSLIDPKERVQPLDPWPVLTNRLDNIVWPVKRRNKKFGLP